MKLRSWFAVVGVLAAAVAIARTQFSPAVSAWPPQVEQIESPAREASGQPQLTVSSRGVLLSWVERDGDFATLKFAERTASGWTEPQVVASGSNWFVNWADVPSVVRLGDGTLYAHWLQKSGQGTYAYDVRLSRSIDDGRTWSPSVTPHHDGTQTEHGFASLFQMPGGGLGLVWLDGRQTESHASEGHGTPAGAMTLRSATFDASGAQTSESAIDLRVCECCPTAAIVTADGPLVAYRDRSEDEIRDISVVRLVDGQWSAPAPLHEDRWHIEACPVNGPALSADGNRVAAAWFTADGEVGHAFAAFSDDGGRSFGAPVRLDEFSALGRVDVALLPDGSAVATWIEFREGHAQFAMRHVARDGTRSAFATVAGISAGRASGYPRLARAGDELVFAWTDSSQPARVLTAVAALPADDRR